MKQILLVAILITISIFSFSQEPASSQGKQAFTTLNATLEKLKTMDPTSFSYQSEIDKATKRIQTIKQYDPTFDLSAKEQQLQSFVKIQKEAVSAKEANKAAADAAGTASGNLYSEMEELYQAPSTSDFQEQGGTKIASDAESILNDFRSRTDAFIANDAAGRIKQAKDYNRYIEPKSISYEKSGLEDILKKIDEYIKNSNDLDGALVNYYLVKKYEIYWNSLEKAMPDDTEIKANAVLARKYAAGLSSISEIKTSVDKNKKASLANVKVPNAVRKDANTEALFRNAFNATGWNETIFKINLLDSDWHIERNSLTGVITGRHQTAAITAKNRNGDCILYTFTIIQEYNGSSYQSTAKRYGHLSSYMSCDNAQ